MNLLRMLGALCLFGCGCALGLWMSARLRRRLRSLEEMRGFFERMCASIGYAAPPMEEVVREIAEDGTLLAARDCLVRLRQGEPFPAAFAKAVQANAAALSLTSEDAALLVRAAERLGRTDAKGQAALLRLGIAELEPQIAAAAEDVRRRGKLYRSLGVLGGLAGVILLI